MARVQRTKKTSVHAAPTKKGQKLSAPRSVARRGPGVRKQTIELKAIAIVNQRYPDARSVTHLESRDFMDGTFVSLSFKFPGEDEDELIYIYFDDLDPEFVPRVCEMEDEFISLASDLKARQSGRMSHKILDYIFREGGASVVIALILMVILAYSVLRDKDVGTQFWNLLLLVVGFYFGSNKPKKET